ERIELVPGDEVWLRGVEAKGVDSVDDRIVVTAGQLGALDAVPDHIPGAADVNADEVRESAAVGMWGVVGFDCDVVAFNGGRESRLDDRKAAVGAGRVEVAE